MMKTHVQSILEEIDAAIEAVRLESQNGEEQFIPQIAEMKVARLRREREWVASRHVHEPVTV